MSITKPNIVNDFFGNWFYIILAVIGSVPIFLGAAAFIKTMDVHEDEAVATAITISFFAAIFTGRSLGRIVVVRTKSISPALMVALLIFIVAAICWLFFHADFPLQGRPALNLFLFWLPFLVMSIALGMLVKMFRTISQLKLVEAQSVAEQSRSELHLLQSQLSPHFLFNTLNNMYGLSITKHEQIPPLLLKLSELLRYSVYEANELFVPLKNEVAYIYNYIEFEKLRIDDKLVLKMDIEEIHSDAIRIAPMLLIVFIENAFKHSKKTSAAQIFIDISLKISGKSILFSVKNSHNKEVRDAETVDKNSGFGLANTIRRLNLLYPDEYQLDIQENDDFYTALLLVKIK